VHPSPARWSAAVARTWHTYHSQGLIPALAYTQQCLHNFDMFPLRLEAVAGALQWRPFPLSGLHRDLVNHTRMVHKTLRWVILRAIALLLQISVPRDIPFVARCVAQLLDV